MRVFCVRLQLPTVVVALAATATPALAEILSQTDFLPTSFVGEVLTVSLAFSLPAILAGLWLAARRAIAWLGWRGTGVIATVAILGLGFATVTSMTDGGSDLTRLIAASLPKR